MRTISLLIISSLFFLSSQAQIGLSSTQWQEDLRFLQNTIHQDYPFLLKKISKEDFDASVEKLHADIPNLEEHEIIVGLARIVSSIKYGHTAISLSSWNSSGPVKFHRIPVNFYWYNDGMHLQGVHKKYENALGAKVLEIEGMPIEKALKMSTTLSPKP